jgi:hypothetical protein
MDTQRMAIVARDSAPAIRLNGSAGHWVLLATVLGSSMAFLDATVVNVALPTIGRNLGASLGGLQWTVTAYTLTLAGLILLGGRPGRRRIFILGVGWFALPSALCGLAPSIGALIAGRTLQGIEEPCSPPAHWRSSRPRSQLRTGRGRWAPGRVSAGWPEPRGRCSAAGSCRPPGGAWSSCSTCRWPFS